MRSQSIIGSVDQNIYVVTLQTMIAFFSLLSYSSQKYTFKNLVFTTIYINILLTKILILKKTTEKVG